MTPTAVGEWLRLTDRAVSHLVRCGRQLETMDPAYATRLRRIREMIDGCDSRV